MALVLRQAFLIASKDTRIFFKDRFAMAFAFLFPFIFIVGWSAALSGQGPGDEPLNITLVTREDVGVSLSVIEELSQSPYASVSAMAYDDALASLQNGEIDGFVVFPADFTQKLVGGASTSLGVVVSDDNPEAEAALSGLAQEVAGRFTETQIAVGAASALAQQPPGGSQEEPADRVVEESSSNMAPSVGLEVERAGGRRPVPAVQLHVARIPYHVRILQRGTERGVDCQRAPEPDAGEAHVQWHAT